MNLGAGAVRPHYRCHVDIEIREVGPRDGLQVEAPTTVENRIGLIDGLAAAGLEHIEAVSFVSPKAVPSMANPTEVMAGVSRDQRVTYWGLVPNLRGAEMALAAGMDALTVTVSACPVYNTNNVRQTIDVAMSGVGEIVRLAGDAPVDLVLSCVFGSPYTGDEPTTAVPDLMARAVDLGVSRVTLADTTGMATPARLRSVIDVVGVDVGLHLHDTRGTALANAWEAVQRGVRRFDTALGGLGGSPFAAGAGGNLATEDLVHVLDDAGLESGVNLEALLALGDTLREIVGHELFSPIARFGPRWAEDHTPPE